MVCKGITFRELESTNNQDEDQHIRSSLIMSTEHKAYVSILNENAWRELYSGEGPESVADDEHQGKIVSVFWESIRNLFDRKSKERPLLLF